MSLISFIVQDAAAIPQRTVLLIYGETISGQDMFIRGGIDSVWSNNNRATACSSIIGSSVNEKCSIPITHLNLVHANTKNWRIGDNFLDWGKLTPAMDGREFFQIGLSPKGEAAVGTPAIWTTNDPTYVNKVYTVGGGFTPLNTYGKHYWMLDVAMECDQAVNGWFEFKTFISHPEMSIPPRANGWEVDIRQTDFKGFTPPSFGATSKNHMGRCGMINVFKRDDPLPKDIKPFPTGWPVATFTTTAVGASVSFDAASSSNVTQYRWDLNGDGVYDSDWSTTKTANVIYTKAGIYKARLWARDETGRDSFSLKDISISAIPSVVNQAQSAAKAALVAAGFKVGTISQAPSNTIPAGNVISQTPTAGLVVGSGQTVDLTISTGALLPIPKFVVNSSFVNGKTVWTFDASASQNAGQFAWDFNGDGVDDAIWSNNALATFTYTSAGVNHAKLKVRSALQTNEVSIIQDVPVIAVPNVVNQTQTGAQSAISAAGLLVGTITQSNSDSVPANNVISQIPSGGSITSAAMAVSLNISQGVGVPLPLDPMAVAPAVDTSVPNDILSMVKFLYSGANPIQTGVAPDVIDPKTVAVIRGQVLDRNNVALGGVAITIKDHAEFGQTLTRADGRFDLAVNGGGQLVLNYDKSGYLPSQRSINTPWRNFVVAPDVVLLQLDSNVTTVRLADPGVKVARGSATTDGDGNRQATIVFPEGVQASMKLPGGASQPLQTINVRATEYTVGTNGKQAMPGSLPPQSGYTYAVELSVDEALAAKAETVEFSQPVYIYVENFLNFPVGSAVPIGYYDRNKAAWIASDNGRVIKVLSSNNGIASVDVDGDDLADTGTKLSDLGFTDSELRRLAITYLPGQTLWRSGVKHFTPWDCNWPWGPPDDYQEPTPAVNDNEPEAEPDCSQGSIVECDNQVLGESVPVAGTPFTLEYRSDRQEGFAASRTLDIRVSGAEAIPRSLLGITLDVVVEGQHYHFDYAPAAGLRQKIIWDGKNIYGQPVVGVTEARVLVTYTYVPVYYPVPEKLEAAFGRIEATGAGLARNTKDRTLSVVHQSNIILRNNSFSKENFGGWGISGQYMYLPEKDVVLPAGGPPWAGAGKFGNLLTRIVGGGVSLTREPVTQRTNTFVFNTLRQSVPAVAAARDGSIYYSEGGDVPRIRKVNVGGIVSTIVGFNTARTAAGGPGNVDVPAEGIPAIQAWIGDMIGFTVGPDNSIYFGDVVNASNGSICRIRKVTPDGLIRTIAGGFLCGQDTAGKPALQTKIGFVSHITVDAQGVVYFSDEPNKFIRSIGLDGVVHNVAGDGSRDSSPVEGANALTTTFDSPGAMTVAPDGSLYVAMASSVYRVAADGKVSLVAGSRDSTNFEEDGIPATQAALGVVKSMKWDNRLGLVISCGAQFNDVIRVVGIDGIIKTLVGGGADIEYNRQKIFTSILPRSANLDMGGIDIDPQGNIYIGGSLSIYKLAPQPAFLNDTEFAVPQKNGKDVLVFSDAGRHLRTVDAVTGKVLLTLRYDEKGLLIELEDMDGNVTRVSRPSSSQIQITSADNIVTQLNVDSSGMLKSLVNPANEQIQLTYSLDGLLTSYTNARNQKSTISYELDGRLKKDENSVGGFVALERLDLPKGYRVTTTTVLGRKKSVETTTNLIGQKVHVSTGIDQKSSTTISNADGKSVTTEADGTVVETLEGADGLFGATAPMVLAKSVRTPLGLQSSTESSRKVSLAQVGNPLTVTAIHEVNLMNGKTYTRDYNAATRTWIDTSPVNRMRVQVMDDKGRLAKSSVPGLASSQYSYDLRGRLETVTVGDGVDARITRYGYDAFTGFLKTITDPGGQITSFDVIDAIGRVKQNTLPGGRLMQFDYDADGNMTSLTPAGKTAHGFGYTPLSLVNSYTAPSTAGLTSTVTTYAYDLDRAVDLITRPDGSKIDYSYETTTGRLNLVQTPRGSSAINYLASTGQVSSISSPDGISVGYTYDGFLLKNEVMSGAVSGTVGRVYFPDMRLKELTVNGSSIGAYGYDNDNLITLAGSLSLTPDSQTGLLRSTQLGNVTTSHDYNTFGELSVLVANVNGAAVYELSVPERDKLGRIKTKVETVSGVATSWGYSYDAAGRLESVTRNGSAYSSYTYDLNGNRKSYTGPQGNVLDASTVYDAQDRLMSYGGLSYQYAANGELKQTAQGPSVTNFSYDVFGNLNQVKLPNASVIDYLHDGLNRRVGKKVNGSLVQAFLYQTQLQPIAELNASGQVVSRFVYASRENVPDYLIKAGETYRIVSDQLGSVRLVVNSVSGAIAQRIDYDEFGNVLQDTNPGFQPFGFAGGFYDKDTKLVRFGVRDYDAKVGRWTVKDPVRFKGGLANLYGYIGGDPINLTDSSGLQVLKCSAPAEILGGTVDHQWLKTDTKEAGMGGDPNGSSPNKPYSNTQVQDQSGQSKTRKGATCKVVNDVDEKKVNDLLKIGRSLGPWSPWNNCQTFASHVLDEASTLPKPKPFDGLLPLL